MLYVLYPGMLYGSFLTGSPKRPHFCGGIILSYLDGAQKMRDLCSYHQVSYFIVVGLWVYTSSLYTCTDGSSVARKMQLVLGANETAFCDVVTAG